MAGGDMVEGVCGQPETRITATPLQSSLTAIAESLREEIMVDVEAVLKHKADDLWERGQAEISKMQQDRKEVATSLAGLQQRQELLTAEHSAMHNALLDITTKLEFVVLEMREAVRSMNKDPQQCQLDGTCAVPLFPNEAPVLDTSFCLPSSLSVPPASPAHLMTSSVGAPLPGVETPVLNGLHTPPRVASQVASTPPGPCLAPPLPGSPAVLLSLASALPSASPSSAAPLPALAAGPCRLHIADCLDAKTPTLADSVASAAQSTSSASTGSPPTASLTSSPDSALKATSSSSESSPQQPKALHSERDAHCPAVTLPPGSQGEGSQFEDACWTAAPPGLSKAPAGTLRAEAPAFVPRGSFS